MQRLGSFILGCLFSFCCLIVMALSPINQRFNDPNRITEEFNNLINSVQPRQWKTVGTTPTITTMQNSEVILLSSTTKNIAIRLGQTIYYVQLSTR